MCLPFYVTRTGNEVMTRSLAQSIMEIILGLLELLSEYDDFLKQHIQKHATCLQPYVMS